MNLRNLVEGLTIAERTELLDILTEDSLTWTTMPPHIEFPEEEVESNPNHVENFAMHDEKKLSEKRKQKVNAQTNTWKDTGEHKDVETPDIKPSPRNRPSPKIIDVTCRICGKSERVNSAVVYGEYYRCNNCIG